MADYYSILKKTIEGLPNNTPQIREAVYTKARAAIEKQLRNIDPAPAEDVIAAQLELLETAISSIDGEYAGSVTPSPEPVPAPATSMNETLSAETATTEPTETSQAEDTAQTPAAAPVTEPVAAETAVGDLASPPSVPEPPSVDQVPPPPPEAMPAGTQEVVGEQPAVAAPPAAEPPSAPVVAEPPASASPQPAVPPPGSAGAAPAVGQAEATDAILDKYAKKPKPSLIKRLLVPLIILVVLLAGGFGLWASRDTITPMVASLLGGGDSSQQNEPSNGDAQTTVSDKEAVKLGADGQDEEAEPIETPETPAQGEASQSSNEDGNAGETAEATPTETAPSEQSSQAQETEQAQAETPTETQPVVQLPPGEPAYLYQEADGSSGVTKTDASVAWSVTQASPFAGFAEEPVITAVMSVPEKSLSMEMHMSRNVDETLSASHVIDMQFEVPADFAHGSIDNVTRFVMKNTEEARGEPLAAVPVKVRDNQFLIALDNLEQAVQINRQLLLNSNWIDINVTYADGKRALLTLSKGAEGGAVFQSAFNDWANR